MPSNTNSSRMVSSRAAADTEGRALARGVSSATADPFISPHDTAPIASATNAEGRRLPRSGRARPPSGSTGPWSNGRRGSRVELFSESSGRGRVLIRCDKCNTLYELDDELVPVEGALVQCSKCQYVFTTYPSSENAPALRSRQANDAGRIEASAVQRGAVPAGSAPENLAALAARPRSAAPAVPPEWPRAAPLEARSGAPGSQAFSAPLGGGSRLSAVPKAPSASDPQFTPDGRPIRKVTVPVEESPQPTARPAGAMSRLPVRPGVPSRRNPIPWVIPLAIIAIIALAFAIWRMLRVDRIGHGRRADVHSAISPAEPVPPILGANEPRMAAPFGGNDLPPPSPPAGTWEPLSKNQTSHVQKDWER